VFSRTSFLALAAIASIGAAALITSASSADARGFGGGFSRGGGIHFGGFRSSSRHAGLRFHHRRHWQHHHRPWQVRWHRPWIYGVGTAAIAAPAYAAVAPKPAAGPCTCLTKEYTKENLVVFKDRCTKETAAAPIGGMQPQQSQAQPPEPMPTK
jgi:hypothetical protein